MIDTNVRNVKKLQDGTYFALTKAQQGVRNLCDHCTAAMDCKHKAQKEKIKVKGVKILECQYYRFPLVFRDDKGLEDRFNTLRLGKAWFNRLEKGDLVGLLDQEGSLIGNAAVLKTALVERQDALDNYAHLNHLCLGAKKGSVSHKMERILRNSYGNLVFNNNDHISVIDLRRVD